MELKTIQSRIYEIRGQKVMLDFDLALLYETETKRLKEAVRRNIDRFPPDFLFELSRDEYHFLRTQNASLESGKGKYSKYPPFAFTEQVVAMLSGILTSPKAVDVNIAIMRAFVFMRQYALSHKDLTDKLKQLEDKYDQQFKDVYDAINFLLHKNIIETEHKERKRIGFKKDPKELIQHHNSCTISAVNDEIVQSGDSRDAGEYCIISILKEVKATFNDSAGSIYDNYLMQIFTGMIDGQRLAYMEWIRKYFQYHFVLRNWNIGIGKIN